MIFLYSPGFSHKFFSLSSSSCAVSLGASDDFLSSERTQRSHRWSMHVHILPFTPLLSTCLYPVSVTSPALAVFFADWVIPAPASPSADVVQQPCGKHGRNVQGLFQRYLLSNCLIFNNLACFELILCIYENSTCLRWALRRSSAAILRVWNEGKNMFDFKLVLHGELIWILSLLWLVTL